MSPAAALVMSMTTFAGSAQFAAASTLETGGGALAAIVAAALLNGRYVPIGLSVASLFPGPWWRRLVEAQLVVDESWAIAGRGGTFQRGLLIGAGLLLWVAWVGGTVVGVLLGDSLGDPEAIGLDAGFAELFLALLAPYLRSRRAAIAAGLAAAVTLALVPVAPPGVPLVAASLVCLLGLVGR
jgi:predicted branched-subunit amino acid permease